MPSFVTLGRFVREIFSENPRGLHHPPPPVPGGNMIKMRNLNFKKRGYGKDGNINSDDKANNRFFI